ncbi:hypothetical protein GGF43_006437, partial [Coemansia sp. RSA 2618]
MSIPTIFTNSNCITAREGELNGGGMLQFCRSYDPNVFQSHDMCRINTQEDYNEYQIGCVNYKHGKFVDNNNNTVMIELKPGASSIPYLDGPVEFPIGSHDNFHLVPGPHYDPPYPVFVSQDNCIGSRIPFEICVDHLGSRPEWTIAETPEPEGKRVLWNDYIFNYFADCCPNKINGIFVNPLNGSITYPISPTPITSNDPETQAPVDSHSEST